MTHYLLTPTGRKEVPAPENGTDYSLKEFYDIIGCDFIQVLRIDRETILVFDEDAKLKGQEFNEEATRLAHEKNVIAPHDHFVGNVMVCDASMLK